MEDTIITMFNTLLSYGPLGAIAAYFMAKDYKQTKEVINELRELTIAIETLIKTHNNA